MLLRNAHALVVDLDSPVGPCAAGPFGRWAAARQDAETHLAALRHRLNGVDGEVRQHLLDLRGVDRREGLVALGGKNQLHLLFLGN